MWVFGPYSSLHGLHVELMPRAGKRTLSECFQLFDLIHRVTTDHATTTRIATEVVEDLAADNVIYAELRTTPKASTGTSCKGGIFYLRGCRCWGRSTSRKCAILWLLASTLLAWRRCMYGCMPAARQALVAPR